MKQMMLFLCLFAASRALYGAEATARIKIDNRDPARLFFMTGDALSVELSTDWAGDEGVLLVDGSEIRTISSGSETYNLKLGDFGRWAFVTLQFVSSDLVYTRQLQVLNGDGVDLGCVKEFALDSRTGQVRRPRKIEQIAFSTLWNDGAESVTIKENASELFYTSAAAGDYEWNLRGKKAGRYVLTHDDGVETLSAVFSYAPPGTMLLLH